MAEEGVRTTDTGRVEAFSDGVVAIALTLLVLDLITEHHRGAYAAELLERWPSYLAFLVAFFTIASNWLNHHEAFSRLVQVDPVVRVVNLALLLGVTLVPWPTALLSAALAEPDGRIDDQRAALVVYVLVSLVVAASWAALSAAVARRAHLVRDPEDVGWFAANARRSLVAGAVSAGAGAVGWFAPVVALVVYLLVPAAFTASTLVAARERR